MRPQGERELLGQVADVDGRRVAVHRNKRGPLKLTLERDGRTLIELKGGAAHTLGEVLAAGSNERTRS